MYLLTAAARRRQPAINVCPAVANQLQVAAAVNRRDRQTDGHRTVTQTLTARSGQRQY